MKCFDNVGSQTLSKDIAFVNVKKCPSCKEPINKNGGCSHMMCRCGCSFCWECLTPWAQHVSNGLTCAKKVQETVIIFEYLLYYKYYDRSANRLTAWSFFIAKRLAYYQDAYRT